MEAIKEKLIKAIEDTGKFYASDLKALSHELLLDSPGGAGRSPYDYTYEVVVINNRVGDQLSGKDPGPYPFEGWIIAPDEFKNKDHCITEFEKSIQYVLEGLKGSDSSKLVDEIELPNGKTSIYDMASLVNVHAFYHCGQLNLVQAIAGDDKNHWGD
ncbi:MAG: hypothetical protein R2688_01905 [Fimbriimonadaceae bacterium]